MPELHLGRPEFIYSACGPFAIPLGRIRKLRETSNLKHLYRNKLEKTFFAYDVSYSDSNGELGVRVNCRMSTFACHRTQIFMKHCLLF